MGMQRKATSTTSDVGADMSSTDYSLSFTSLVCIQDQQHVVKPHQTGEARPLPPPAAKHDPEFEFISHSSSTTSSATGSSPRRVSPADFLFSNGQILPQAIPSLFPFPSHSDHSMPSHIPTRRSSRRASESELASSNNAAAAKKKPNNNRVRNCQASYNNNKDESFGQRIFKSISAPCRGCGALEPSKSMRSAQTLSQ